MAKTHNVNLDKALAAIRQYPGARTDRKVFQVIAGQANDKGAATSSLYTIADVIDSDWPTVYESVCRLVKEKLLMTVTIDNISGHANFTIHPDYMLNTDEGDDTAAAKATKIDANTERIEKLEKRIADLENAIKANGNK